MSHPLEATGIHARVLGLVVLIPGTLWLAYKAGGASRIALTSPSSPQDFPVRRGTITGCGLPENQQRMGRSRRLTSG